jgi:rubrerythrin
MPDFGTPFKGNNLDRDKKLTKEEMTRALRFAISAEYEAIQLYQQLAESSDNFLFQKVMRDISNEEKIHVGEFLRVLFEIDGNENKFYNKGFDEVQEMIKKPSKI